MHDARPQLAADAAEILDVMSSAFTSVPLLCPAAGCTTMPGGLVDHHQVRVFVE